MHDDWGKEFYRIMDVNRIVNVIVWNNISFRFLDITFVIDNEKFSFRREQGDGTSSSITILLHVCMFNSICWTFSKIPEEGEKESPKQPKNILWIIEQTLPNFSSSTRYIFLSVEKFYLRRKLWKLSLELIHRARQTTHELTPETLPLYPRIIPGDGKPRNRLAAAALNIKQRGRCSV